MLTIAIGDIHGMALKLEKLLSQVESWLQANDGGEPHRFVFLGDYIDRGPQSREVLEIVMSLRKAGAVCLRGNHEALLLGATESETGLAQFVANGGDKTIASLGDLSSLQRAQEWVRELPTCYEDALRFYVHAGVCPGVPLEDQHEQTKLWIRGLFLRHTGRFPKYIVHGHTPTIYTDPRQKTPEIRDNRCNLDTGAGMMGFLSAAVFNDQQEKPIHTISVDGDGAIAQPLPAA